MSLKKLIISLTLLPLIASCGYQFQGSTTRLPSTIKTIYISNITNESTNTTISGILKDEIIDRFEKFNTLEVVDNKSLSDVILKTTITGVNSRTSGVTGRTDIELESDISIEVASQLIDTKSGQILWDDSNIISSESYANINSTVVTTSSSFAQSTIDSDSLNSLSTREVSRSQEEAALEELAVETAKKIYNRAIAAPF